MTIANITGNRVALELVNSSVLDHNWGLGAFGTYERKSSNTYTLECFLSFDTSVIPIGSVINSCTLDVIVSGSNNPPSTRETRIYENNRSNPSIWLPNGPHFDDFTQTLWTDDSTEKSFLNSEFLSGLQTWPSTANFVSMVDGWVQQTKDWNWGCVISAKFEYFDYYVLADSATLNVDYSAAQLQKTNYYYGLNYKRKVF